MYIFLKCNISYGYVMTENNSILFSVKMVEKNGHPPNWQRCTMQLKSSALLPTIGYTPHFQLPTPTHLQHDTEAQPARKCWRAGTMRHCWCWRRGVWETRSSAPCLWTSTSGVCDVAWDSTIEKGVSNWPMPPPSTVCKLWHCLFARTACCAYFLPIFMLRLIYLHWNKNNPPLYPWVLYFSGISREKFIFGGYLCAETPNAHTKIANFFSTFLQSFFFPFRISPIQQNPMETSFGATVSNLSAKGCHIKKKWLWNFPCPRPDWCLLALTNKHGVVAFGR